MKRKSRDWDLTLELSCHAGCPTGRVTIIDNERPEAGPCDLLLVIVRVLLNNIDDIVIFACQL